MPPAATAISGGWSGIIESGRLLKMPTPFMPSTATVINHPLLQVKLTRLRDRRTQPEEFRARLAEVSALLVFEATRDLGTRPNRIQTPLAACEGAALARPIILMPILRAGNGMVDGMLSMFPDASVGHI